MADYEPLQSPKNNYRHRISSIFSSPKLFTDFVSKGSSETESIMSSPTSILDSKSFSALKANTPKTPKPETKNLWEKLDSGKVGLGLIDVLIDEKPDPNVSKLDIQMVFIGSQLKIQVPPPLPPVLSPADSPIFPGDFGIKTRNSHVGSFSPRISSSSIKKFPFTSLNSGAYGSLSASEMELSEDYTCVISHGPNPKTTHIFDDCIVESCNGVVNGFSSNRSMSYPSESFLSFCYNCKRNLGQGKDIYMYRGEKAFCSSDCRDKEMMLEEEEGLESMERDYVYGTS
ncbi:FCS-Like Zinc finger 8-like isoform X1 [Primulina huaijiensis]|uniref:FCS-Like Zinc finger 8-like isoform X1 n=1 Tax=Primulina huaijiensis TaxID=1492673 RepID=UPI003CC729B6